MRMPGLSVCARVCGCVGVCGVCGCVHRTHLEHLQREHAFQAAAVEGEHGDGRLWRTL